MSAQDNDGRQMTARIMIWTGIFSISISVGLAYGAANGTIVFGITVLVLGIILDL